VNSREIKLRGKKTNEIKETHVLELTPALVASVTISFSVKTVLVLW
jgi:hypothetical protein